LRRSPPTDLAILLTAAFRAIKRRALLFVISDFLSVPGWQTPLGLLTQRHEVLAVRLTDPRETELPDIGSVFFEDAETGEQLYLDTSDARFRERYARAAREREEGLRAAFGRVGVDTFTLSTEGDLVESILRFASMRRKRKQTPAAFSARASRVRG